jgi:hypothetical protein
VTTKIRKVNGIFEDQIMAIKKAGNIMYIFSICFLDYSIY